jgi:glucose uptake protein
MILPTTYATALLLTILSMLCWGSWANTLKLSGQKWRFELFYYDYSFGVLLTAIVAAFTFGTMGIELTFLDNLALSFKRNIAYGFAAGAVFNLANMLLVAAISVAGLAVAFPIGIGLALVIGVVWNYLLNPQGNPILLFAGSGLVVAAIIVDARAYSKHARKAGGRKSGGGLKGILLSLISGVLMGSFYPLVVLGKRGEFGLGPYAIAFIFAIGVFFTTFLYNLYFLNLPVQGEPVEMVEYFRGTARQHLLGVLGGVIWCAGTIANFVAASAPQSVQVGPAVSYAIGQGATMVSALWGLLLWKEFAGASSQVKVLLALMLVLFLAGLSMVSIAPLFAN